MTIIESCATVKLAMFLTKQRYRASTELYALGMSNVLAGFIGLLPMCLPISRNILTLGCFARSRFYCLFCLIITVVFTWIFWGAFLRIPVILKSVICIAVGLSLLDFNLLLNYFKYHRKYSYLMLTFVLISCFIELSFSICFFYVIFFASYVQNELRQGYTIANFESLDTQMEFYNVKLTQPRKDLTDQIRSAKISPKIVNNLSQYMVVYQLRGTFNFLNDHEHVASIKIQRKVIVVLDFRYVIAHDCEYISEYLPLLNRVIKDSRMELFVTGIPREMAEGDAVMREGWMQSVIENNRIVYIN